jgi:hypothetical protein
MIDSVSATLSIWSQRFSPGDITAMLGAPPDREVTKGVERIPPRPLPIAHGWHLAVECGGDVRAEQCLSNLLNRAEPLRAKLAELRSADPHATCKITVHFSRARSDASLEVSADMLSTLASLGASLFVDTVEMSEGNA